MKTFILRNPYFLANGAVIVSAPNKHVATAMIHAEFYEAIADYMQRKETSFRRALQLISTSLDELDYYNTVIV